MEFNWRGDECAEKVLKGLSAGLTEFGLRCETAGKRQLQKGHGVVTGTLRRSTHIAEPGYAWMGDNTEPSESSPEQGGREAQAGPKEGKLTIEFGSGMEYAMAVHQGHGGFEGYHWLTNAVEQVKGQLPEIMARRVKEALG